MHLTDRTDFALRVMIYLSVFEARASVATVAAAFGVSEAHLAKVTQALARHGFIDTAPGRAGGMVLARAADAIRVGEVVRALEPFEVVECFRDADACPARGPCGLEGALRDAREAFLASLDAVTLADVSRQQKALRERLGGGVVVVPLRARGPRSG